MKLDADTQEYVQKISEKLPTHDGLLRALVEQHQVIDEQQKRIDILEQQLRLLRTQRFGKSSEKSDDQGELFNEAELTALNPEPAQELEQQEVPDKPKKKKKGRQGLSPDLPRQQILLTLSDEEKADAIDTFFVTVKEELDITPAKVQVLEYRQEKAVLLDEAGERRIVEAVRPAHPLGKAICSTQLLAYIIVAKYCDSLPLYRMEGILKRYGGSVSRTTLAQWLIKLSLVLQPLINLMQEVQLSGDYMQGDETRMKVLKEPGMEPSGLKWMWVMRGGPPDKPVVLFNYDKSRGKAVAKRLLEDFQGRYFQSDGYASYDGVCKTKGIVHLGCMDHYLESLFILSENHIGLCY
ncbi:MAG: transposase [Alteromonas sp.]|nr:transposase [Alteromonas sp.]